MIARLKEEEISEITKIAKVLAEVLDVLIPLNLEVGKSFQELDEQIGYWLANNNILGIKNFVIDGDRIHCYSHIATGNIVVHGLPSQAGIMMENTSFRVDLVGFSNGVYADAARTYMLGNKDNFSSDEIRLIEGTRMALTRVSENIRVGHKLSDIAKVVERTAREYDLYVVKELTGHAIRNRLHDSPYVLNYYNSTYFKRYDEIITDSTILCIEPIFALEEINIIKDKHQQILNKENCLTAHFEDTILFLSKETIPLTKYLG